MKLFFTKDDTLYKIMKSLEKIPKGKTISLYIDYQNSFFAHPWWGKQIVSLLEEKTINYVFVCKHSHAKKYFEDHGIAYEYQAPNRILHTMHLFGMLLFNAKKFHLTVFTKKTTLSYLFIIGEIVGIGAIMYIMYQFLVPSVNVLLQPAYTVEDVVYNFRYYPAGATGLENITQTNYITVPYQIGSLKYTHDLSVPIDSLQYLSHPSQGTIAVYNTLPIKFTLKQGTTFITNDGVSFTANQAFILQPGKRQSPSITIVTLTADDKDSNNELIGERGNIGSGTRLLVKKLTQSSILGAVYATSTSTFTGGSMRKGGIVTNDDISLMKDKLIAFITGDNKKLIVKKEFHDEDGFLLPIPDKISMNDLTFTYNATSGQKVDILEGKVEVTYRYPYVIWHDLMQGVSQYVGQRPSQTKQLISIQKNTATFYDTYLLQDYIVIPTKVSAVWGYDFAKDTNHIKDDIIRKIAGLDKTQAQKIIVSYPEISSVVLKTSPVRSDTLPTLKSRIYFRTTSAP